MDGGGRCCVCPDGDGLLMIKLRNATATAALVLAVALLTSGCGAGRALGRGDSAARAGDWDTAVENYRKAVQKAPGRTDYKIALQRAMINAANIHTDQARVFEVRGQLDDALREY